MKTLSKTKSIIYSLAALFFSFSVLVSCGGGGGSGGGGDDSGGGGDGGSGGGSNPFTVYTLDTIGDVGWFTSIATGSIHISYYDSDKGKLKYAYAATASGPWSIVDNIDLSGSDVGAYTSIVLDSSGNVHIVYYDWDYYAVNVGNIKYATNTSGWSVDDTIDSSGNDMGMYSSMAIDSVGAGENIHISYYDFTNGDIYYVKGSAGSWNVPANIDNIGAGLDIENAVISLAIDSNDKVHIAYYDDADNDLNYTNNVDGTLTANVTTADNSTDDVGSDVSLSIDSSDRNHISYYNVTDEVLVYATCLPSNPSYCTQTSDWTTATIDSSGSVGEYSSIAIDSNDNLHVSYTEFDNVNITYSLKYATCLSTDDCTQTNNWSKSTVDSTADVGEFSSIAVDSNDVIYISYYDNDNGNLKLATK